MPYLDRVVDGLNKNWITSLGKVMPKASIQAYAIAETIVDVDMKNNQVQVRYPGEISEQGDVKMITPDGDYTVQMYHRIEGITNTVTQKSGYGDTPGDQLETANMSLIVFASRKKLRKTPNWLEAAIKDSLPDTSKMKDNNGMVLQTSAYKIGNSSFDKLQLLNREYSEVDLNFIDVIVLELKYRIESTWRKGCFEKCNC